MKRLFVLSLFIINTLGAPEGYNYNKDASSGNLNTLHNGVPCKHISHLAGDSRGAAADLIQSQSTGRIINHPHHHNTEYGLETAASGLSPQSQAVTVNSHIVVGDSSSAASGISGASQEFHSGEGYVQGGFSNSAADVSSHQLPPLPQQPVHFNPANLAADKTQGYSYQQQHGSLVASHGNGHIQQHHYAGPLPGPIKTNIGPPLSALRPSQFGPPPPPNGGYQYAAGYTNNAFNGGYAQGPYSSPQLSSLPLAPAMHFANSAYRPPLPGPIGGFAAPRPVQHFESAQNYQQGSGAYAGSFEHNTHGSLTGYSQFGNAGSAAHGAHAHPGVSSSATLASTDILNGQLGHVIRETFANAPLDPTIEKHIYVHVPPEDLEENGSKNINNISPQAQAKKHYKIIFIKAPTVAEPNYAQLAAAAAQQSEEKTLVYVLVKKPEEPSYEEIQQLQQNAHKTSKPEVYFIKYKTRKEGVGVPISPGPVYTGPTQYNSFNDLTNSAAGTFNVDVGSNYVPDVSGNGIDIRFSNGESSSVASTSTSYTTSSSSSSEALQPLPSSSSSPTLIDNGPKQHELYGVPLEK